MSENTRLYKVVYSIGWSEEEEETLSLVSEDFVEVKDLAKRNLGLVYRKKPHEDWEYLGRYDYDREALYDYTIDDPLSRVKWVGANK